jgi:uncharacterized protein (DUF433 family)
MIAEPPVTHIRLDKAGTAWIDDTNVKVVEIIEEHLAHGEGPDELHAQHPHLSLAQIHSAFAYYFDHRGKLDTEIQRRHRAIEALRAKAVQQPTRKKLLARLAKR